MFSRRRREPAPANAEPGDGSALPAFRPWHALWRTRFFLDLQDGAGTDHAYAVDVDFLELDHDAVLYRDGSQVAKAETAAVFDVPGGVIEVDASLFGLKWMRMVHTDGREETLRPHRWTSEAMRARFGRCFPRTSRAIGVAAIVVLLVSLVLGAPQMLELVTSVDVVADLVGTFDSPISLPGAVNTGLLVASIVAGVERALTLRNHWLIDLDTLWWNL